MKFFKNDRDEHIDGNSPQTISLQAAIRTIESFPRVRDDGDDFFLGFVNDNDETIQFVQYEDGNWMIDVPIFKGGKFAYSVEADDLDMDVVKEIVTNFFKGVEWKHLCKLERI